MPCNPVLSRHPTVLTRTQSLRLRCQQHACMLWRTEELPFERTPASLCLLGLIVFSCFNCKLHEFLIGGQLLPFVRDSVMHRLP